MMVVALGSASDNSAERARVFAETNQLELVYCQTPAEITSHDYVLFYQNKVAVIYQSGRGSPGPVSASFVSGAVAHRRQYGGGKGQMLAKAIGVKSGITPSVIDATAGLGRDAFVLATLGCRLTLLERSAVIQELLLTALEESRSCPETAKIADRMTLISADSINWLEQQKAGVADVIYLDPMFPHRDKSAQVKKEMRLFQQLLDDASDNSLLLAVALAKARFRVVVKRPKRAGAIPGPKPTYDITGKSCRYDIYALRSIDHLRCRPDPGLSTDMSPGSDV
jgi:16S rRNA (guanine1516-N2)-methyltransferase